MKVAYLTPRYFDRRSYIGGGERSPVNLARGLVESSRGGCTVELISYDTSPRTQELYPGVTLRTLPPGNRPAHPSDVVSWELPAAIEGADLVHIQMAFTRASEMGLLVARQQRKPVCVTDRGMFSSRLGWVLGSLDLADRIVCQSDFGASVMRPFTSTPIEVIKGGVHVHFFGPPAVRPPRDRVLFVGQLVPHKGVERLIEALPPELPLSVCSAMYREDYLRRLQALAAGKRVEFILDADDEAVRELYRRAWVNVLPSVYRDVYGQEFALPELMGNTLLEAMACGTPAVCSRVGGMPEFIREGETGFVFDDVAGLTRQLRLLASDPALVERMGRRAREVVEQEFSHLAAGAKLLALYEGLIAGAKGRAA